MDNQLMGTGENTNPVNNFCVPGLKGRFKPFRPTGLNGLFIPFGYSTVGPVKLKIKIRLSNYLFGG